MRPMTELQRALTACAAMAGLAASGCRAQVPTFDGTYAVAFQNSSMTLTLRTLASGDVVGWIQGGGAVLDLNGRTVTDDDGDVSLEGILTGPGGRSDFTLYPDDDGAFGLTLTPYDASGTPRADQASVYAVTRITNATDDLAGMDGSANDPTQGGSAPAGEANASTPGALSHDRAGGKRDPRLVGTWSTQVIMSSDIGSMTTQLRMQFCADGIMRELDSRSLGDIAGGTIDTGSGAGDEQANWRTEDNVIWISYAGSQWIPFARFELSGPQLLLTYLHDHSRQLWSRVAGCG